MKQLIDFKDQIHKCSKCGLCQAECPIYKVTGNDCAVSRGHFVMLKGILKGELRMSNTINRYLDLCLKCGACSKSCPSGIDVVDVIIAAKSEYFKTHSIEKLKTFVQKYFIFGLIPRIARTFLRPTKSKAFEKKVLYFGGCGSKLKGDKAVVKILNSVNIEVINPSFHCCGIPYFSRGDLNEFNNSIKNYINILKKYEIDEVITTCASCEKSLKEYVKWVDSEEDKSFLSKINVSNIYKYLKDYDVNLELKRKKTVTYHKPCNIENIEDIKSFMENVKNLEYIEMNKYDQCCGLSGASKIKDYGILSKIFLAKQKCIGDSGAKIVLTSCLGCELALNLYSFGKYRAYDLLDFIVDNI